MPILKQILIRYNSRFGNFRDLKISQVKIVITVRKEVPGAVLTKKLSTYLVLKYILST